MQWWLHSCAIYFALLCKCNSYVLRYEVPKEPLNMVRTTKCKRSVWWTQMNVFCSRAYKERTSFASALLQKNPQESCFSDNNFIHLYMDFAVKRWLQVHFYGKGRLRTLSSDFKSCKSESREDKRQRNVHVGWLYPLPMPFRRGWLFISSWRGLSALLILLKGNARAWSRDKQVQLPASFSYKTITITNYNSRIGA